VLDRRPVFAIDGALFYFTPEAYVRQVCCCWQTPWLVILGDSKRGIAGVLAQIRAEAFDHAF
jgi:hypothetical protein